MMTAPLQTLTTPLQKWPHPSNDDHAPSTDGHTLPLMTMSLPMMTTPLPMMSMLLQMMTMTMVPWPLCLSLQDVSTMYLGTGSMFSSTLVSGVATLKRTKNRRGSTLPNLKKMYEEVCPVFIVCLTKIDFRIEFEVLMYLSSKHLMPWLISMTLASPWF